MLLAAATGGSAAAASESDARLSAVAREARRAVAIISDFYIEHRACPQPTRSADLVELQAALGDGFSVETQGRFVSITGVAMPPSWFYYSSPGHPDRCTLWRKLDGDAALVWRRYRYSVRWTFAPGDGRPERPIKPTRL